MRTTVFLIASLLAILTLASIDMTNANDKQLPALLSNHWYNLLPQRVINERANMLRLLAPNSTLAANATHAQATRSMHLATGRPDHI